MAPGQSSQTRTSAPSPQQPLLTRKASSDLSSSSTLRGGTKRQRTKSISSNASSSSNNNYHSATVTSASASSSTSLASALSNITAATSNTALPSYYHPASSRSPAAMIIPSPTMSISMYASPSPAASSSSYIPPSPPVSLGLSPNESSSYLNSRQQKRSHPSGCGVCDSSNGINCICQDIGLKRTSHVQQQHEEEDELDEADFKDLNLLPSSSRFPSEMDRCGFCTESTTGACLCAEVGMRGNNTQPQYRSMVNVASNIQRDEGTDTLSPLPPSRLGATRPVISPSSSLTSVANRPPGSASVRLRLPKRGIAVGQIWRIEPINLPTAQQQQQQPLAATQEQQAQSSNGQRHPAAAAGVALRRKLIKVGSRLPCSGDPRTCLACADDP